MRKNVKRPAPFELSLEILEMFLMNPGYWSRQMEIALELQGRPKFESWGLTEEGAIKVLWDRVRREVPCTCTFHHNGCATCRTFGLSPEDPVRLLHEPRAVTCEPDTPAKPQYPFDRRGFAKFLSEDDSEEGFVRA